MKLAIISFFLLAGAASAQVLEPVKHRCVLSNGIEVRIVGRHGDLIEVHDRQSGTFYPAYDELREEMGGKAGFNQLSCRADVYQAGGIVFIRTGHNNDYAHMYGIERLSAGGVRLHQLRLLFMDSSIEVRTGRNNGMDSVALLLGRKRDRFHRYCWDGKQWFKSSIEGFTGGWGNCDRRFPDFVRKIKPTQTSLDVAS